MEEHSPRKISEVLQHLKIRVNTNNQQRRPRKMASGSSKRIRRV